MSARQISCLGIALLILLVGCGRYGSPRPISQASVSNTPSGEPVTTEEDEALHEVEENPSP